MRSLAPPGRRAWRWLGWSQFGLIAITAIAMALLLRPAPHSDWLYYWKAAGDWHLYRRGGLGVALLSVFKALGWPAHVAALALNLPCAGLLLGLAYRADRTRWKWLAQLVAFQLWLLAPFYGIVQLDLLGACLLAWAFAMLLESAGTGGKPWMRCASAILLAVSAVSTKPQLALVIWAMIPLLLLLRCPMRRRWPRQLDAWAACMLVAACAGFGVDYGARAMAGQSASMRTSSAVTLYGGLLVSNAGAGCGYWSKSAAEAAKADLRQPLPAAIGSRLRAQPPSHWLRVVECKIPQIVLPPPYALYWLVESPNVRAMLDRRADRERIEHWYAHGLWMERLGYRAMVLAVLATVVVTAVRLRRRGSPAWGMVATTWVAAFWLVHAVFEIQGRYFLPLFLLAPLLCAWASSAAGIGQPVPAAPPRLR